MKIILGPLVLLLPAWVSAAPVQLAQESFEGIAGEIGYTQNFTNVGSGFTPMCAAVDNNGSRIKGNRTIAGGHGSKMFAGARINASAATAGNFGPTPIEVTTNSFTITGKINTSVKLRLAAPGDHDGSASIVPVYDYGAPGVNLEYVRVSVSIDGSPFVPKIQYSSTAPVAPDSGSRLTFDANMDGTGGDTDPGGNPSFLDDTFREVGFNIPTGSNVRVMVTFFTNGSYEYILFDDIRIFGETAATNPPVIAGVSGTLNYTEGSAATLIASGLTLADSDSATLPSATVSITQGLTAAEDVLSAQASGQILQGDISYANGVLSINRSAPVADYQAVLASVRYQNTNLTSPSTATRHVSFNATDGTNPSNSPVRQISVIDLVPTQAMPYTESFETDGRGTRYNVLGGFVSGNNLFARINPSPEITGIDGDFIFAAERTQTDAEPLEAVTAYIDTTGYANLKLDLLAAIQGGNVFEQADDFLLIQTSVDGGTWTNTGAFRSTSTVNGALALDADLNGTGEGTALTASFQDFRINLPSATTLGIRIVAASDGTGERILFDNLRVTGDQASFAVAAASAAESATSVSIPVTRSGNTTGTASVSYTLTGVTATAGTDFTATGGTVSFTDGQTTANIVVPITADNTVELDETFTATISNPSTGVIATASATGTITNDDSSVISLAGNTVTEGDTGTVNLPFDVSLTNPVDVDITVSRQTLATGSATAGTDFTALSAATLTIPAGQTTASFNVSVTGDHDVESAETIVASLSTLVSNGRDVSLGTVEATGTVTDDDPLLVAGNGALAVKIGVSGKVKISDLLALTTIVEGRAVSLVPFTTITTAQGGTVTIVDGWIHYQPPAGYSGPDSFTFSITDGVQTVTGTVFITASAETGATVNIFKLVDEGDDKRVLALGIPGRGYRLQISDDLSAWTNSGSVVVCPAAGTMSFLDEGPLPETRFYRVIEVAP
jgi:hypothetical protein